MDYWDLRRPHEILRDIRENTTSYQVSESTRILRYLHENPTYTTNSEKPSDKEKCNEFLGEK